MTHRATIERDTSSGSDAFGAPVAPEWTSQGEAACYVWSRTRRPVVDGEKVVTVQDLRAAFPRATDIAEGDRLQSVQDRIGTTLFPGPLTVRTVEHKPSHQEVALERV